MKTKNERKRGEGTRSDITFENNNVKARADARSEIEYRASSTGRCLAMCECLEVQDEVIEGYRRIANNETENVSTEDQMAALKEMRATSIKKAELAVGKHIISVPGLLQEIENSEGIMRLPY